MSSGATTSAGWAKKDWGRCWEGLRGRAGYGSGCVSKCRGLLTSLGQWAIMTSFSPQHLQAMSEEQLAALLAKLKDDAGLQEKLKGAADLDAAVALAKEAGFDISKADWLRYQAIQTLELSDEELEDVAGGCSVPGGAVDERRRETRKCLGWDVG